MCCFCCRLKLFLEQFGIPTCVLNSELPAAIRCLSVNQFNQGVYDIIIASDERSLDEPHAVKHVGKKGYICFCYHLFTGNDFTLDRCN